MSLILLILSLSQIFSISEALSFQEFTTVNVAQKAGLEKVGFWEIHS